MHYRYRGYVLYKFDGYYDVHEGQPKFYPQPVAEGFYSAKDAKAFIDKEIRDSKVDRFFENGLGAIRL